MRAFIQFLLLASAGATTVAAQQPDSAAVAATQQVTLDEAIRRALTVQPAMVQALGDQRNAGAASRSAWGAFLPTFSTSASASRSNQPRFDPNSTNQLPPVYSYSGGLTARLELFDGFRRFANLRATNANGEATGAGVLNQRFQVMLQTKQAFYDALAKEDLVLVAEAQVRRAQQQLVISVQKLHAGSATRSDSLRSVVDFGNARLTLLQAQANLANSQATLGRQIGMDVSVRAVADSILPGLPDTTALRGMLLETAPQVVQADAQARAARSQVWTARAQYWPSLTVTYSNNRTGTASPSLPLFSNYPENFSWSFGLSWTLFNGFSREQSQVTASVNRDVAEARAADMRRQVGAQLTQQMAALGTAFTKLGISSDNVAAATEDLRVQQERYRVGAGTILDLLTSQASLTQAQTDLVQARFDYLIARAQLEALVGHEL
ncbi:MAG TPA: TolC family protein [Gemmatimonadales bacterium]|nr:TolC family protein [Gemmatimonadales bacterium]